MRKPSLEQLITWAGVAMIAAGLVFNEWGLSAVLGRTESLPPASRVELLTLQLLSVFAGIYCLAHRRRGKRFFFGCIKIVAINLAIIVVVLEVTLRALFSQELYPGAALRRL
jgi:hypothetical protein